MAVDRLNKIAGEFEQKKRPGRLQKPKKTKLNDSNQIDVAFLHQVESVTISDAGAILVTAWADDRTSAIHHIRLDAAAWSHTIEVSGIGRLRSAAADIALATSDKALHGLWSLSLAEGEVPAAETCLVEILRADGSKAQAEIPLVRSSAAEFKDRVSRFIASVWPGDLIMPRDTTTLERILRPQPAVVRREVPRHTIENISVAERGGVFVAGWVNDTAEELAELRIDGGSWRATIPGRGLARTCRDDVQNALGISRRHPFGFWGVVTNVAIAAGPPTCTCEIVMRDGATQRHEVPIRFLFDQIELRNLALTYLATSKYAGNPQLESVACLEKFLGRQIIDLNVLISRAIVSRPHVERFGLSSGRPKKGSIVVCLYGRAEYLMLQNALFAGRPGIEDYEFVYVSNSPELAEQLMRDARIATMAYGHDLTLVLLPGNAGFGAANNAAVAHAESGRVLIVNPDVFPFDQDWAARHSNLLAELPAAQTRLFGAPLYYDDGSLMHGGMYFDGDPVVSMEANGFSRHTTLRVEHYGKGAPAYTEEFLRSRPVPAVTGAFISIERSWFERLGGFSDEYVLGHYEDADLCLKSLQNGTPAWVHDVKLWHLEGKGSARRQAPHEGGSIVNRWLFNRRWAATIVPDLLGSRPSHPLIRTGLRAPETMPRAPALVQANPGHPAAKKPLLAQRPETGAAAKPQRTRQPLGSGLQEIVFGVEPEWELES
jgi:GT2 family glycosyltransferase